MQETRSNQYIGARHGGCRIVMSECGRQRQENNEFRVSLGYTVTHQLYFDLENCDVGHVKARLVGLFQVAVSGKD